MVDSKPHTGMWANDEYHLIALNFDRTVLQESEVNYFRAKQYCGLLMLITLAGHKGRCIMMFVILLNGRLAFDRTDSNPVGIRMSSVLVD